MSRHSFRPGKGLSPVLGRVIQAAKASGKDAEGRDIRGAAGALQEFGALALWALPIHGMFVPNNSNVCVIVDRVAKKHLGRREARREFQELSRLSSCSSIAIRSKRRTTTCRAFPTRRTSTPDSRSA